jgi:hypothetical protein
MAEPSLLLKVTSAYKGGTRTWSNRYHFTGGTPADLTHWTTLANNVVNAFKACLDANETIVEAIGYAAGSDVPVATIVYSTAGTATPGGSDRRTPLDSAALIRWSTPGRSTKNHPIYCFNYVHAAWYNGALSNQDTLSTFQKTALQTFATAWVTGFSDGTITAVRASPSGHTANGSIVEEYLTHHDFPYVSSV